MSHIFEQDNNRLFELDFIQPLSKSAKIGFVGNKAKNLIDISDIVTVPRGFCLSSEAFGRQVETWFREFGDAKELIKRRDELTLSSDVSASLNWIIENLKDAEKLIVRSSGSREDLDGASYAGVYDSILDLRSSAEVKRAVIDCWLSVFDRKFAAYQSAVDSATTSSANHSHPESGFSVIVQHQIDALLSGVIFSVSPAASSDSQVLIEFSSNSQSVVDGLGVPESIEFDLNDPERLVSELTQFVSDAQKFSNDIVNIVTLVSEHFGKPVDLEWVYDGKKVFVVQSRPISAIRFGGLEGEWSTANFSEIIPGLVTPMSFSLTRSDVSCSVNRLLNHLSVIGEDIRDTDFVRRFLGRAYWNSGLVKSVVETSVPFFSSNKFDESVGTNAERLTAPSENIRINLKYFTLSAIFKSMASVCKLVSVAVRLYSYYLAAFLGAKRFRKGVNNLIDIECNHPVCSLEEAWRQLHAVVMKRKLINSHAMAVTLSSSQVQLDLVSLLDTANGFCGHKRYLINDLISVGSELATASIATETRNFASRIKAKFGAKYKFSGLSDEDVISVISSDDDLHSEYKDLINKFSYISEADEELANQRLDENPRILIRLLSSHLYGEFSISNQKNSDESLNKKRPAYGWIVALFLSPAIHAQALIARHFIALREEYRIYLARIHYKTRRALLEYSIHSVGLGALEKNSDIFYLEWEAVLHAHTEIGSAAVRKALLRSSVNVGRSYEKRFAFSSAPAVIGRSLSSHENSDVNCSSLHGLSCQAGLVEAVVCVITSLDNISELRPGCILVTRYLNPAWIAIFPMVSGIVTEEGGLLSHGAVVAREMNIPCVLQVKNATTLLKTGDPIRLEAGLGIVEIREKKL